MEASTIIILAGAFVIFCIVFALLIRRGRERKRIFNSTTSTTTKRSIEPLFTREEIDRNRRRQVEELKEYEEGKRKITGEYVNDMRKSEDDGFATSMLVGMATNNAALGMAVGGNPAGAILGDMMSPLDENMSVNFGASLDDTPSCDCDCHDSNFDSSSSSDYSSSCDSISDSSCDCSCDCGSSDSF